ncbi:uncharacterized protein [Narcine bancroftii]|uniref:uncharacterized protein n=1 Tax=Narcine bancroftii TaxID=1343680 RepID=UPI0038319B8C
MAAYWGDGEVRELLSIRAEMAKHFTRTVKDGLIYQRITTRLREAGFLRDKTQVINKLKNMRKRFLQLNDHNRRSGRGRMEWPYFDLAYQIWGVSPSASPVALISKMERPESSENPCPTETATSSEISTPSETPVPSKLGYHNKTGHLSETGQPSKMDNPNEAAPISEMTSEPMLSTSVKDMSTNVTNASSRFTAEPPQQPGSERRGKRRRLTRSQEVTAEIRGLLMEIDQKDQERDRLRHERRAEREERMQRAHHSVWERSMDRFASMIASLQRDIQEQTGMMREMLRMMGSPARPPAPQSSLHPLPSPDSSGRG